MADWPDVDELKQLLDVQGENAQAWDDHLESLLEAGIAQVKQDVGAWEEGTDQPTDKLHHAALRAAVLMRPNAPMQQAGGTRHQDVNSDPAYQSLLQGYRRRFGLA